MTPLHQAAFARNLELVRLLVDADPTRRDPAYDSTPLGWAEHAGADDVADYLRRVSADR
jgi:ankyrin repeat protein